jgi:nucleoside permease NupC
MSRHVLEILAASERRADLARVGLKSMIVGLLACYLFAVVVGVLI